MLATIKDCIEYEMEQVTLNINSATQSNVTIVSTIGHYAVNQPGRKMIRPMILLLLAKALNYKGEAAVKLATIIELIHAATLLHDDVIDHANIRRNKPSTHKVFGGTQSILMGDFIYASAFKLIASLNNPQITHILAQATQEIVEGEIKQLSLQHNIDTSLEDYHTIIRAKTALLFSTGAQCIHTTSQYQDYGNAIHDYGFHFGMLYQMTDDILDIDTSNITLNKAHGTDLSEGKMTLPTLLAYQHANKEDKKTLYHIVSGEQPWQNIIPILERTHALDRCKHYTQIHCQAAIKAISKLPDSIYKKHLINLVQHIPKRKQ